MRRGIIIFFAALFVVVMSVPVFAALEVIGTAVYDNGTPGDTSDDITCNLIWDDDNNGNSVIWFDYTHAVAEWQPQKDWAAGLDAALTIIWNPGVSVTWSDAAWRLPDTVDGMSGYGCDGTTTRGYSITTSEMGHLFYTELGNQGRHYGSSCDTNSSYGLQNTGPFNNLIESWYWSGTQYAANSARAWGFGFGNGRQNYGAKDNKLCGLALRSGQVVGASIPTLSEWGQILLVVMLGVSALWMKRRQSMMV